MSASNIFVVAAKRTPFGSFGGALSKLSATDLGVAASQACLANVSPQLVDSVLFGNVIQSSSDAAYLARHVGLKSGVPIATPCLTVNRLCGSGLETVILAQQEIQLSLSQIVLAGGTENMSQAPLQVNGIDARWGVGLGVGMNLRDSLWDGLSDSGLPMGMTAENLAQKYGISREECDAYALRSQQLWGKAQEAGVFEAEMAPIEIKHKKKGTLVVDTDEHPRPTTTLEQMAKLKPVFDPTNGVVTAANASGICDGAGAVLVASEQAVQEHQLQPLARIVSTAVVGCDPKIMGIGPVPAIQMVLQKAQLDLKDVDRIEINEAFAAQVLACAKELNIDMDKLNLHGGGISLGHPLGASGSRILAHLAHEFAAKPENKYHLASACIGGGQGIAVLLERV